MPNHHDHDVLRQRLDELLHRLARHKGVPHAVMGVETMDGAFRWAGAAGQARPDGEPMRPDTPFYTASVTKPYTAAVVLKLYERGGLGLDEPMAAYLPGDLAAGLHRREGRDLTGLVTVRNLLGHTSGLPDYFEERPSGGWTMGERLEEEGDIAFTVHDVVRVVRDDLRPHFPPQPAGATRQKARYADTNYQLLGAIIEAVTGEPLHRGYESLLLEPLGLRRTWLAGHPGPREALPEPAAVWLGDRPLHAPRMFASIGPDGGIISTVAETISFMRALVRGDVFDDPATAALMQQRWNRLPFPRDAASIRTPGWPFEYGLGLMRFDPPRAFTGLRSMPAVVGHVGATGSWLYYCPGLDLLLSGTVDQPTAVGAHLRILPRLLRAVGEAIRPGA